MGCSADVVLCCTCDALDSPLSLRVSLYVVGSFVGCFCYSFDVFVDTALRCAQLLLVMLVVIDNSDVIDVTPPSYNRHILNGLQT